MLVRDRAICIRTVDYSETSQVVTLFTREHGKVSAIAKGAKRSKSSFGGPLEVLGGGEVLLGIKEGAELATLAEFEAGRRFANLSRSLLAMNCGLFGAELLNSLTEERDSHPKLFDVFVTFLEWLDKAGQGVHLVLLIRFQLRLLKEIGLGPVFERCVNCGRSFSAGWRGFFLSGELNGFVCADCEASFPDRVEIDKRVGHCLAEPKLLSRADDETVRGVERLLVGHFTEMLGREPRLGKYILENSKGH